MFIFGFSAYVCFIYLRPRHFVGYATPEHLRIEKFENIELKTEDGLRLKGWYIPSKTETDKAVILCHGYPADKGDMLGFCPFLHQEYNLLLFDFRGLGESEGFFTTIGFKEVKDLEAAVVFLKERGAGRIGALGFSMGGAVLIMANNPDIKAIVSDSAFADFNMMIDAVYKNFRIFKHPFVYASGLIAKLLMKVDTSGVSPLKAAGALKTPLLIIHGEGDKEIDARHAHLLHEACQDSELWLLSSARHGEAYYLRAEEYEKRVLEFFGKHL